MGDSFEKRFKQVSPLATTSGAAGQRLVNGLISLPKVAYPLYLKHKHDQKMAELIKYMKKSFMFCDLNRMDSAFFDNFIDEVTQPEDDQSLLKAIDDFVRYLKDIRDEEKVKNFVSQPAQPAKSDSATPDTSDHADSQPTTPKPPSSQHRSQLSEADMHNLEVSLKSAEISINLAHSSSSATSSAEPTAKPMTADTSASTATAQKRKITLIPIPKSEQSVSASAFTAADDDDCVTPKPSVPDTEDDEIPSKMPKTSDQSPVNAESQDESEYLSVDEAKALDRIEKYDKYLQVSGPP